MHRHTAGGKWAVELLQCTTTLPAGNGHLYSCHAPPLCLWTVGNGNPAMHCHFACGQGLVEFPQFVASLPVGSVWYKPL